MSLAHFLYAEAPIPLERRVNAARKARRNHKLMKSLGNANGTATPHANAPRGPQATLKTETILQALRQSPCPLRTSQVVAMVGAPHIHLLSARLSRMASWGQIARQRIVLRRDPESPLVYCLWSALPTSPAQVPFPAAELGPGRQLPTTAGPASTSL